MPIDTTPTTAATAALKAMPFGNIIGGPLTACVEAQAQAARTSWEFIQNVGLYKDEVTGEKKTVNVSFQFMKDGHMSRLTLPLLTIVPIPFIAIQTIDINFKANISAAASDTEVAHEESATSGSSSFHAGCLWARGNINASYSSKKDSTATKDSKYSVEYTMDVAVHATQDSMPAGLAKVLEMLNNSLNVSSAEGNLDVSDTVIYGVNGKPSQLIATYRDSEGLYVPDKILVIGADGKTLEGTRAGNSMAFMLPVDTNLTRFTVQVTGTDQSVIVTTQDRDYEAMERKQLEEKEAADRLKRIEDYKAALARKYAEEDAERREREEQEKKKQQEERKKQQEQSKKQA